MTTRRTTAPLGLAVSLAEAKETLRIESADTSLDVTITLSIKAITLEAEHYLNRSLVSQGFRQTLDAFPSAIQLEYPPILSVTSVKYRDSDDVEQTLDPADYLLDSVSEPSYLVPASGTAWPSTYARVNAVMVDYTSGYGIDSTTVPENIKNYILVRLQEQFDPLARELKETAQSKYAERLLNASRIYA